MTKSGLVSKVASGPARYVLSDATGLRRIVGALPTFAPRWEPIFQVLWGMHAALEAVSGGELRQPQVALSRRVHELAAPRLAAGLPSFPTVAPERFVDAMQEWTVARRGARQR